MGFSPNGIPILSLQEKLDALKHCFENRAHEDALGHIGDLFHYALTKFNQDMRDDAEPEYSEEKAADVWIHGMDPTPIDGPTVLDDLASI